MKVLLIIDMQNDFVDGALGTKEAQAIVPAVAKKLEEARANGEYVIFTRDTHEADYMDTQEGRNLPVPHCIRDSEGWQIVPQLAVGTSPVVDKPAFGSMTLAQIVSRIQNVEEIQLCGLCTDICVISNAMILKAALPETTVRVLGNLCAGVTPESHENALAAMKMCQILVD